MRRTLAGMGRAGAGLIPLLLFLVPEGMAAGPSGPAIRLGRGAADGRAVIEVVGLDAADRARLAGLDPHDERWRTILAAVVDGGDAPGAADRPPMLGSYGLVGEVLQFRPRFPLEPGLNYRVACDLAQIPGHGAAGAPIVARLGLPEAPGAAPARVGRIYPSADRLPENLLRFYIHFSAPMSRGGAYEHIHLLDGSGRPVPSPFLELGEELWDPSGVRFTLLINPGRIKQGLKPREELGPVLVEGGTYTLVIDADWLDARGRPLAGPIRKTFRAGPADESPPEPRAWAMTLPPVGSTAALVLEFPEPLDHALLGRVIGVQEEGGRVVPGQVAVEAAETRWRFTPERPWLPERYRVVVETSLEDLAGNGIGRPFEVDVFGPIERRVDSERVLLPFRPGDDRPAR